MRSYTMAVSVDGGPPATRAFKAADRESAFRAAMRWGVSVGPPSWPDPRGPHRSLLLSATLVSSGEARAPRGFVTRPLGDGEIPEEGQRLRVPRGTTYLTSNPARPGEQVAGRSYVVRAIPGEGPGGGTVVWSSEGGYCSWTDPANVEIVEDM